MNEVTPSFESEFAEGDRRRNPVVDLEPFALPSTFWSPVFSLDEAAIQQAPFLFWVVEATRPKVLMTLGDGPGCATEYILLCQAIERLALDSRAYWFVQEAGKKEELSSVEEKGWREEVEQWNFKNYSGFSRIVWNNPEKNLRAPLAGCVDVLSVHGKSFLRSLEETLAELVPLLSERGVMLVHGVNDPGEYCDVQSAFFRLADQFPSFEFTHGDGLGVLAVGVKPPVLMDYLLEAGSDPVHCAGVRNMFSRLGDGCLVAHQLQETKNKIQWLHNKNRALEKTILNYEALLEELMSVVRRIRGDVECVWRERLPAVEDRNLD